jgi:hypothetical protein
MRVQLCREIPLGRLAAPEDPARVVVWLLSEEAAYMTGSHVVCDGGILAKSSISKEWAGAEGSAVFTLYARYVNVPSGRCEKIALADLFRFCF